jgi:hypothetical protein
MSGDGGFTMMMGEFITLSQMKLPVKIIVLNNATLGFVRWSRWPTAFSTPVASCRTLPAEAVDCRHVRFPIVSPESRHSASGQSLPFCAHFGRLPIRATSPKRTRRQGCGTGNNGGSGVQSQRHLLCAVRGWMAAPGGVPPGRGPLCAYCAVMPPSITSSEPVTQDDSSDARNSTPLAISSAVPSRPIGVRSSSTWRTAGSLKRCTVSGVSA